MAHPSFRIAALATVATLAIASAALAAGPAGNGKSTEVSFEAIPGTTIKRITLSAKAAERLGIELAEVGEQDLTHSQMVGGLIVPPMQIKPAPAGPLELASAEAGSFADFSAPQPILAPATQAADGQVGLILTLSPAEWERMEKDAPAQIHLLPTRGQLAGKVVAKPSGIKPIEDFKRSMVRLYYKVDGTDHGLEAYERVRVELPLIGGSGKRTVVPYSAVHYDAKGQAWTYVSPAPLVYERRPIVIERIIGDTAVLTDGPPLGTRVVSVGAPMLHGTEVFGK